jgi:hypothetical protein
LLQEEISRGGGVAGEDRIGVNSACKDGTGRPVVTKSRSAQTDDRKMTELILYLASRSEEDPRFSATKLNKLLFYCDFTAYRHLGQSITGHSYQKRPFGPVSKAMLPILEQMKRDGDCSESSRDYSLGEQSR